MPHYKLEYIWLDGYEPVPNLRGKTKVVAFDEFPTLEELPLWGFDGSSTKQAVGSEQPNHSEIAGEVGDLLFVAVNVARLLGIDPESALKASNRKFRRRFRYIEDRLREQDRKPSDSDHIEMDRLWDEAKSKEKDQTHTDVRPG